MDGCAKFENIILHYWEELERDNQDRDFWDEDGQPVLEYRLLETLLSRSVADADSVKSGLFAKALDMWIAGELRAAGFCEDAVWPRLHMPRVLDPAVLSFIQSLNSSTAQKCCAALTRMRSAEANVMGSTYRKQVDVGMSSWLTGPEILISTKTMGSSFGKNLANRFEEAYGDAKNLKGRHPLATLGFVFVVRSTITDEPKSLQKAVSMLKKLQFEQDAYDAVALLLVEWNEDCCVKISDKNALVPQELSMDSFMKDVVELTLLRSASDFHETARLKRYPVLGA